MIWLGFLVLSRCKNAIRAAARYWRAAALFFYLRAWVVLYCWIIAVFGGMFFNIVFFTKYSSCSKLSHQNIERDVGLVNGLV